MYYPPKKKTGFYSFWQEALNSFCDKYDSFFLIDEKADKTTLEDCFKASKSSFVVCLLLAYIYFYSLCFYFGYPYFSEGYASFPERLHWAWFSLVLINLSFLIVFISRFESEKNKTVQLSKSVLIKLFAGAAATGEVINF